MQKFLKIIKVSSELNQFNCIITLLGSTGEIPIDCLLGSLEVVNENLENGLKGLLVEQQKINRLTGLALTQVTADIVLCSVQKTLDREDLDFDEIQV